MQKLRTLLPLLTLCLSTGLVWAGKPLNTEDADILDKGSCEWESGLGHTRQSGSSHVNEWETQIGCGFGFNSQAAIAYGRATSDEPTAQGFTLGGKTGILMREKDGWGVALAWGIDIFKNSEVSWKHDATYLNLAVSKELAPSITGHANVGWSRSQLDRIDTTNWGIAAEWAINDQFDLTGEVYGDDRDNHPWLGIGVRFNLSKAWSFNAAYNVQNSSPTTSTLSAGFKFAF